MGAPAMALDAESSRGIFFSCASFMHGLLCIDRARRGW
jgi:hypothetical protein